MAIFNIYSKRKKRNSGQKPDIYEYNIIPKPLRVQMVHMLRDLIGNSHAYDIAYHKYKKIKAALCREYGLFYLTSPNIGYQEDIESFLVKTTDAEKVLDAIELAIHAATSYDDFTRKRCKAQDFQKIIIELNQRFLEHGVGYQFESGTIIRIDSQFVHSEIIKPVLGLLSNPLYDGADKEFLGAHEFYRHGKHEPCIVECLKAFESTMKIICKKRKWSHKKTDTANTLISICMTNNLIPPSQQSQFSSLRSVLESGVPTIRNKQGAHGQGPKVRNIPGEIARYAINLTAANILFLIESEKALPYIIAIKFLKS